VVSESGSPLRLDGLCVGNAESWLVQLATGTKKRVHHWVRACAFDLNGMPIASHLKVLPLGS